MATTITSSDLMDHADRLIAGQSPTAADLNRAISAIYYSLFHAVIETARSKFVTPGASGTERAFTAAFDHKHMRRVCDNVLASTSVAYRKNLLKGALPAPWTTLFPAAPGANPSSDPRQLVRAPDADLVAYCAEFGNAQSMRHQADYNLEWSPSLVVAQSKLAEGKAATAAWNACKPSADAEVFMLALLGALQFR